MTKCKDCKKWRKGTHFKKRDGEEQHICAEKDILTGEDDTCEYAEALQIYSVESSNRGD